MTQNGKWACYAALVAAVFITAIIAFASYEAAVSSDCRAVSHSAAEYKQCVGGSINR